MHIKKVFLIIAACVLILLLCANVFQFVFWSGKAKQLEASYSEQIGELEERLGSIGPIAQAWTVAKQVTPGQKITQEDLKPIQVLKKSMEEAYITNPKEILGKFYKISILPGTPITKGLVMEEKIKNSLRQYDVVANTIPIGLKAGDYIDFRYLMPKGEDYIAMTHKRVEAVHAKTVTLNLSEEEIHVYQSMLVDYFLKEGSLLYMTKYLEPGVQEAAKTYYPVDENILNVMLMDPNVIDKLEAAVIKGSRDILNTADKSIEDLIRSKISSGRASIQGSVDAANALYWDGVEKANKEKDVQQGGVTSVPPQQQPQAQPPQAEVKQPQTPVTDNSSANTSAPPAKTEPQGNGNINDGKLIMQEGIVE